MRTKIFNRPLLSMALVDSGNLSTTLISERFFQALNRPLLPTNIVLRSPNNKQDIVVLGSTPPFKIWIENLSRPVEIEPLVVRDLTYPINLGRSFLEKNRIILDFSTGPGTLIMNGERTTLVSRATPLKKLSLDHRFRKVQTDLIDIGAPENNFMFVPVSSGKCAPSLNAVSAPVPDFASSGSRSHPVTEEAPENQLFASPRNAEMESARTASVFSERESERVDFSDTPSRVGFSKKESNGGRRTSTDDTHSKEGRATTQSGMLDFQVSKYNCYTTRKYILEPKSCTAVEVQFPVYSNEDSQQEVFMVPDRNARHMLRNELLAQEGVYVAHDGRAKVFVYNLRDVSVDLPQNLKLGAVRKKEKDILADLHTLDHRPEAELTDEELQERRAYILSTLELQDNKLLTEDQKNQIVLLFLRYWDAVSVGDHDLGQTTLGKCEIKLTDDAVPVRARVRPLNPDQLKDLRRQLDEWLEAGIIEPTDSPWCSALVPVRKKGSTDSFRWTVDFRALNSSTIKDSFPLPNIQQNLESLSGAKVFSSLDAAGAFHAISMEEESIPLTAFGTPFGLFAFRNMPFGIVNGPPIYSRIVTKALQHLPPIFFLIYIDDILVYSKSVPEHIEHLGLILEAHLRAGMKLKLKKCKIARDSVDYLGHTVNQEGISMMDSYIQRIKDWPRPRTMKELRSYLGVIGYYRGFYPQFAQLTAGLQSLRNKKTLIWTDELVQEFEDSKQMFAAPPIRHYPDFSPEAGRFILVTDWSRDAKSAVLLQEHHSGEEKFIGCVAHKCNQAERNYSANKGEMAAAIMGLKTFEHILTYRPFLLRTDSKFVAFTNSQKENRGIYSRWFDYLSLFHFETEHKPGASNSFADAMSRRTDLPTDPPDVEDDEDQVILDVYQTDIVDEIHDEERVLRLNEIVHDGDLRKMYEEDPVLSLVMTHVKDGTKMTKEEKMNMCPDTLTYMKHIENLHERSGLLYLESITPQGKVWRLCLPESLINKVLYHAHHSAQAGHPGITNTTHRLAARYYFPGMTKRITYHVNNCVDCIQKKRTPLTTPRIQYRREIQQFGAVLYVDTVGPLTAVKYKGEMCRHILTMQDGATRYLHTVPIPNLETQTLATAVIRHWIGVHGVPRVLHSDNGSSFTARLFNEVMRQLGIRHTTTPPYSPEGNRVERAHRDLGSILRANDQYEEHRWPEKLVAATLAYNTCVNRVTGATPYLMVYGRECRLPLDVIIDAPPTAPQDIGAEFMDGLKRRFAAIFTYTKNHQRQQLIRAAARDDDLNKTPEYRVGDLVYYLNARARPGLSQKLTRRWVGPMIVQRIVSPSLIIIRHRDVDDDEKHNIPALANRLRRIDPEFIPKSTPPPPAWDDINSHDLEDEIEVFFPDDPDAEPTTRFVPVPVCPAGPSSAVVTDPPPTTATNPTEMHIEEPPDDPCPPPETLQAPPDVPMLPSNDDVEMPMDPLPMPTNAPAPVFDQIMETEHAPDPPATPSMELEPVMAPTMNFYASSSPPVTHTSLPSLPMDTLPSPPTLPTPPTRPSLTHSMKTDATYRRPNKRTADYDHPVQGPSTQRLREFSPPPPPALTTDEKPAIEGPKDVLLRPSGDLVSVPESPPARQEQPGPSRRSTRSKALPFLPPRPYKEAIPKKK